MAVRGGSVRGGYTAALAVYGGARAVAEAAVLQARPAGAQETPAASVLSSDPGSTVVLRACELPALEAGPSLAQPHASLALINDGACSSLKLQEGGRATAVDCACGERILVLGQGSSVLLAGLAFPPGLEDPIKTCAGGVARELP